MPCKRIALLVDAVIGTYDPVFITVPLLCTGNFLLPDAGLSEHEHLAFIRIPVIEIAHYADHSCVRGPNSEYKSLAVLILVRMGTEEFIAHVVLTLVEQISSIHMCAICLPCGCSPAAGGKTGQAE